jgi:hypothetical protein
VALRSVFQGGPVRTTSALDDVSRRYQSLLDAVEGARANGASWSEIAECTRVSPDLARLFFRVSAPCVRTGWIAGAEARSTTSLRPSTTIPTVQMPRWMGPPASRWTLQRVEEVGMMLRGEGGRR